MTFADRVSGARKRISLWVTIQGVNEVFKETSGVDASTYLGESRTEVVGLYDVVEGMQELDLGSRSVKGGGLSFKIRRPRDGSVDQLFNVRARAHSYIGDPVTKTQTSLVVLDNTLFSSAGGIIYIGGETIEFSGVSGAFTLTGLTRGKYGSLAQDHAQVNVTAASTSGAGVYLSPPAFAGRRVTLYASFLNNQGEADATEIMGTFSIEKSPRFTPMGWEFSCAPLTDEIAQRVCYSGVRDAKISTVVTRSSDTGTFDVTFEPGVTFNQIAPYVSHLLVTDGDGKRRIYPAVDIDGDAVVFTTNAGVSYQPRATNIDFEGADARHVCMIGGNDGRTSILSAITSVVGDGANGGYDNLPGLESTDVFSESWRMGAAVPEDYVDIASFLSVDVPMFSFAHPLAEQISLADLLSSFCITSNTYWTTTRAGLLSVKPIADTYKTAAQISLTIDSSNTVAGSPSVSFSEEEIFSTMSANVNYDPGSRDFGATFNIKDQDVASRYQNIENPLKMDVLGVYVDTTQLVAQSSAQRFTVPGMISVSEMDTKARRWMQGGSQGRGRVLVSLECSFDAMLVDVGDTVNVDVDELPSLEGSSYYGQRYIDGTAEVKSRRINWDKGTVELTLRMREKVFAIAPFFLANSRSTTNVANDTLTSLGTAPGESTTAGFFVGQQVAIWEQMDYAETAPQILTIVAIPSSTVLVFNAAVTPFVAAGTWVTWDNVGNAEGTETASGHEEDDLMFNVTGPQPGTIAEGEVRRWQ